MKNGITVLSATLLLGMLLCIMPGCSGDSAPSNSASSDSAPTDEEVLKAINNSGLFTGGVEKFILKSPIEVVERGGRNSDGSWPAKVKITFISTAHGQGSPPMEKTPVFRIYKSKNSAGMTVWKAVVGS